MRAIQRTPRMLTCRINFVLVRNASSSNNSDNAACCRVARHTKRRRFPLYGRRPRALRFNFFYLRASFSFVWPSLLHSASPRSLRNLPRRSIFKSCYRGSPLAFNLPIIYQSNYHLGNPFHHQLPENMSPKNFPSQPRQLCFLESCGSQGVP